MYTTKIIKNRDYYFATIFRDNKFLENSFCPTKKMAEQKVVELVAKYSV